MKRMTAHWLASKCSQTVGLVTKVNIDRVQFKISYKLQVTFHFINKIPHHKAGNYKRAKVPSYPKGKLGRVQNRTHTHSLRRIA